MFASLLLITVIILNGALLQQPKHTRLNDSKEMYLQLINLMDVVIESLQALINADVVGFKSLESLPDELNKQTKILQANIPLSTFLAGRIDVTREDYAGVRATEVQWSAFNVLQEFKTKSQELQTAITVNHMRTAASKAIELWKNLNKYKKDAIKLKTKLQKHV